MHQPHGFVSSGRYKFMAESPILALRLRGGGWGGGNGLRGEQLSKKTKGENGRSCFACIDFFLIVSNC